MLDTIIAPLWWNLQCLQSFIQRITSFAAHKETEKPPQTFVVCRIPALLELIHVRLSNIRTNDFKYYYLLLYYLF